MFMPHDPETDRGLQSRHKLQALRAKENRSWKRWPCASSETVLLSQRVCEDGIIGSVRRHLVSVKIRGKPLVFIPGLFGFEFPPRGDLAVRGDKGFPIKGLQSAPDLFRRTRLACTLMF